MAVDRQDRILRGALSGVVAGAVASLAMDLLQSAVAAMLPSGDEDGGEPATEKAADAIATTLTGNPLGDANKPLAGQAIHYVLGLGLGMAYGIAAEFRPTVTAGYGTAFGGVTASLLDEAAVPAVGLGPAPWKSDLPTTLYGYASHLVFGVTTEYVRQHVRATLSA